MILKGHTKEILLINVNYKNNCTKVLKIISMIQLAYLINYSHSVGINLDSNWSALVILFFLTPAKYPDTIFNTG